MVNGDGTAHTLTHVGLQDDDDDDDDDEEEENDFLFGGGNDNNVDDVEMMEAGLGSIDDGAPSQNKKKRQYFSIAHEDILANNIVYIHLDLEHIGTHVIQISVTFMNYKLECTTEWTSYIKPPADAEWEEHACRSHKLKATDACIINAGSMLEVWPEFKEEVEKNLTGGKVGMLIAWGGKGSDCGKLFEITEAGDYKTFRWDREKKKKMPVNTHPIVPNYIKYMRGVVMIDQSMNDYSISQRSDR